MTVLSILYKTFDTLIIPPYHSILEISHIFQENFKSILQYISVGILLFALAFSLGYYNLAIRCLGWVALGVASSAGFGFGAHTFVLFLAPHIIAVTLAAHGCKSKNFPDPSDNTCDDQVTFLNIFQRIGLDSFMWGLGTAIGELPPYLAARFHAQTRCSGLGGDNIETDNSNPGLMTKVERWMVMVIKKIGFIGILLCAAIPNPLFDAAGLAAGSAQIPFLSFFGATFIGKAIIKASLQSSFVILAFHDKYLDHLVDRLDDLTGRRFKIGQFLEEQRTKVLRKEKGEPEQSSIFNLIINWIIYVIFALFLISLVRNLDKQYRERRARVTSKIE